VTSLGNGSLSDCIELESVILGNQVPSLGRYTFTNDYKLSSITLPASIASIGEQAFSHCTKLATINFQQNMPPSVNADSFMDVANGAMGYYPATAVLNWVGVTYSGITLRSNDQVAPVIALIGANELTIYKGSVFIDPGATVTDNVDTARTITGGGTVNTATVGVYTLTYTATDASGNLAAQVTRVVSVVLNPAGDEDGDGATNEQEYAAGTNPNDANSHPEFFAYRFTFRGPAGRWSYQGAVFSNPGDQATVTGRIYGLTEGTSAAKRIVIETVTGDLNLAMIYGGPNPVEIIPVHAARNSFTVTNGQLTGVDFAYTYNSSSTFQSDFSHTDYVPGNQALNLSLSGGSLSFGSMSAYGQIDVGSSGAPTFQKVAPESDFNFDPTTGSITGYSGQGGELVIPATIGGVAVTKIGNNAFIFKSNLAGVVIPEGVTSIGTNAFLYCTSLVSITIPDSVIEVGENAFYRCESLIHASIGSGLTVLPRNAFSECLALTSVRLGANVKTLGDYAFNNCLKLSGITFPVGFETVGTRAFAHCAELTTITFPESVSTIGSEAFSGCTKLSLVYFQRNTPSIIEWGAFNDIAYGAMGYYPATASANWRGITYSGITIRSSDQTAPVISLIGANELTIYKGSVFTDLGATVTDNVDATRTITGSGTVNTAIVGAYILTYATEDAGGNLAASVTRTVNVVLDPAGDEDGDGATNEAELAAGTNPNDSASGPYQPVAFGDAFTAKLAAGMTTKVTTASLISNDKYSGISGETRGVTFVSTTGTSAGGGSVQVKAGWLIYQPSPSAQNGTTDTFTYTVSNGIKTTTGTVTVSLVAPNYEAEVAIDRVSGSQVYFSAMPGMTFEVQGASQPGTGATWTTIAGPNSGYWTSGADGRLTVTDPAAVGSASRFYKFRWIP
jgi:hypothetical protein